MHAQHNGNGGFRQRAADLMVSEILESVASGSLRPGDRLGSELDLIRHFGLSRAVVREALRILEREEIVHIKPGPNGGVFCKSPGTLPLARSIDAYGLFHQFRPDDLAEARLELEVVAVRLAAERATRLDLEELERHERRWVDAVERADLDGAARANAAFHLALARVAHNPVITFFMDALEHVLFESALELGYPQRRAGYVAMSHRELLEPVKRRDATGAGEAMRHHLQTFRYKGLQSQNRDKGVKAGSTTSR